MALPPGPCRGDLRSPVARHGEVIRGGRLEIAPTSEGDSLVGAISDRPRERKAFGLPLHYPMFLQDDPVPGGHVARIYNRKNANGETFAGRDASNGTARGREMAGKGPCGADSRENGE